MTSHPNSAKTAENMPGNNLSAWQVETLRLTAFSAAIPDISSITWWEELTGEQPETKTVQPRTGTLQVLGRIKGGLCNLSLECQPQRIDWLFSAVVNPNQELTGFPTFASLPDGLALYKELLFPWIGQFHAINRVAFGAVLTQAVDDRRAGYLAIARFLPAIKLDAETSTDFSYQINRPRQSSILDGLDINRLSRWSVAALSGLVIQVMAGQPVRAFETSGQQSACRLELDVNTSPQSQGTLPSEKLPSLVNELVELGTEIARKGDEP